jgi:hypothetical protein
MATEFRKQFYGQYVNLESGTVHLKCLHERGKGGHKSCIITTGCCSWKNVHLLLLFAICCFWLQILESSKVLLNMVQREASSLKQTMAKKINAEEAYSSGMCLVSKEAP